MSKVSVIIAAYNVDKYIEAVVNSVTAQTLKDIEIIAVDDCSTDSTFDILQQLAAMDQRIRVIRHEKNRSAMIARKTGVANATGEYVMFLDGDDLLSHRACERAYDAICNENVDILQFETKVFSDHEDEMTEAIENSVYEYLESVKGKVLALSTGGLLNRKKINGSINFTVWNKIYKRELLAVVNEHIPEEHLNMAEDVLYSYLIQFHARSFSYLPKALHKYRLGGISTSSQMSEKKLATLAKSLYVYTYLKNWTDAQDGTRACEEALEQIRKQMYWNIADTFFQKIGKHQRNHFIARAAEFGSVEDIILALSEYVYAGTNASLEQLAEACKDLDLFRAQKQQAKTIGVYYYRIRNGGVENVLSTLTDLWVKSGYRVVLFTDEAPNKDDYYVNPLVERVVLPAVQDTEFETQAERISVFRSAILEYDIDIMVYNAWVNTHLLLDEMIIKSCGARLIIHTHGMFCFDVSNTDSASAYHNSILSYLYEMADLVVALTDTDVAWWRALGVRVFKTINPIRLPLNVAPSPLSGNHLLLVGRISPEKQVLDAIRIVELVKDQVPDVVLTIVGKGDLKPYVEEVEQYIKKNGLKHYVKMAGFDTEVLPYYQKADILLSTSKFEGFGLALMESRLCGLPTVCYELPNLDITRGNRGIVSVPQSDVKAAANAIVEILQNDALKKQLGAEARADSMELYGIDLGAHWDQIFSETLKPKPEPISVSQRSPLEAAVNIATDFYSRGIWERSRYISHIPTGGENVNYYAEQCRVLSKALKELSESESYRFGLFMTAIPRKIHNWWKRRKS